MSSKLEQYLPGYFDEVVEMQALMDVENELFDALAKHFEATINDQFILSASEEMLLMWERIFGIIDDLTPLDIQFRRERLINRLVNTSPFTFRFLRERLDALLGIGNYKVLLDHDQYTMHIESSIDQQRVFNEMVLTIHRMIPANIAFTLVPIVSRDLDIDSRVYLSLAHFKRVGDWQIGVTPFEEVDGGSSGLATPASETFEGLEKWKEVMLL